MQEKENILRILEETKLALKNNDAFNLKELSNQTSHTASMTQDSDNITIAVIVYSLSKIIERIGHRNLPGWNSFYKIIVSSVNESIIAIKKGDDKKLKENLMIMRNAIEKLSGRLKVYIQDVFRKARINKASKIYEHGISMEKTANLLGITMFKLASYAGQRVDIMETPLLQPITIKSRIKIAEEIFK